MFANQHQRPEFAETLNFGPESVLAYPGISRFEGIDAHEQMERACAADSQLLRLVMCVATATLVLALVSSMA